jgi:TP901 family phage tail tape measure protein
MADLTKTVEIIFGGKNEISGIVGDIGKKFDSLDDVAGKIAEPLAKAADSILKIDAALAALAIGGLALAIKAAGDFNGKFGEITTLISDTGAPIDKFKGDIKTYAVDSVKSIDDINQAIYTSISAGVDYKESIKFVNEAEKLSVAGRSALGDTTKVLVSVLNAYGQGTDQATKYSDIMFTTVKLGLTTMTELSSTLAQVTGLAANAGIPFETLSAAIAALTTTGMPTAQAITSIKAAIQNIIKPTGEAEKMAESLGLQFNAAALKTKGFEGVLWDAWRATGGSTEKMAELFGSVEALNAVLVLSADKTGKFKSSLEDIGKAAGATQAAYDKVANEFGNINQRLENSFKITLGEIGEKVMPEYGKVAGALSDLMKGIKVGVDSGAFDPLFDYLKTVGVNLSQWFAGVAKAFPEALTKLDFSKLISAFGSLGDAIGEYFGEMDLTKADDLAAALQTLIDMVTGVVNITSGMAESFRPFAIAIKDFLVSLASGDEETQKAIGQILALAKVVEMAGLAFVGVILTIDQYKVSIVGMFNVVTGGAQLMWNGLQIVGDAIQGLFVILEGSVLTFAKVATLGLATLIPGFNDLVAVVNESGVKVSKSIDQNGLDAARGLDKMAEGFKQLAAGADNATASVKDIPGQRTTKVDLDISNMITDAGKAAIELTKIPKDVSIGAKADVAQFEYVRKYVTDTLPDGTTTIHEVVMNEASLTKAKDNIKGVLPDTKVTDVQLKIDNLKAQLAVAKKAVDEALPGHQRTEAQLVVKHLNEQLNSANKELKAVFPEVKKIGVELETAKLKEQSAIIQKSIEWTAKVDITKLQEGTKIIEATFKSINTGIESSGDLMSKMFDALVKGDYNDKRLITEQIEAEAKRRAALFEQQKIIIEQQIKLMQMRIEALARGDNKIQVQADGLKPHLEMILWEVLAACQVRANESAAEFLLGVG